MERGYDEYDDEHDDEDLGDDGSLAFEAGYGQALLDAEQQNSSEYWGDRILNAGRKLSGAGMWDTPDGEDS
jgi:hypothetical protein